MTEFFMEVKNFSPSGKKSEPSGSAATNPSDSGEPDGADKDKFISYLNSLSDYGFTVEETGEGYQWNVTDANGNQIEFMCGDGLLRIEIPKTQ